MLLEHERNYGLGMDALVTAGSSNTNGIMVWACSGHRMLLEHERNYGLGMDALVTVCSWNTNGIMVWACSGDRMLLKQERDLLASARGARAVGAGGAR